MAQVVYIFPHGNRGYLLILQSQFHGYWWPGDARSQDNKNPGIDVIFPEYSSLTHWGRVTHICVGKLTIIGWDNGLSPGRDEAIISTDAGILLIRPLGTNYSEISIEIHIFSFKKMHLKMLSAKSRPFCLGLDVLNCTKMVTHSGLNKMATKSESSYVFLKCPPEHHWQHPW